MKKILLIASNFTGHGHKSIAEALTAHFNNIPDIEVRFLDGFELLGEIGVELSKLYGPLTQYAKDVYKLSWNLSNRDDFMMVHGIGTFAIPRFRKVMDEYKPDLILSVHSMFNGSIIKLLKHCKYDVPLVTLQADLINIHKTWCEPETLMTICPTQEAYDCSLRHGMPKEKLKIIGFPTRRLFTDYARTHVTPDYDGSRPLRCLMMSGGEGSGNLKNFSRVLMEQTDVHLTVICGRNKQMEKILNDAFMPEYADRMRILGFVTEMQAEMAEHDVLIARGSPNALMEGVVMNLPLIITGALPGQESDNPKLMESHDLGVICKEPESIPKIIDSLLADDCRRYKEIRAAQREYRNPDNAKNIAEYVASLL